MKYLHNILPAYWVGSGLKPNKEIPMKNLATQNQTDFAVHANGDAFISQRKAAELCGVSQSAISQICLSKNIDVKQGVSSENLSLLITYYAQKERIEAINTLCMLAEAGAKAYIYHQAGLTINAAKAPALDLTPDQQALVKLMSDTNILRKQQEELAHVQGQHKEKLQEVSEKVDMLKETVLSAKDKEIHPPKGFQSISSLGATFAAIFPKSLMRDLMNSPYAKSMVDTAHCTKWVEGTLAEYVEYTAYKVKDVSQVLEDCIDTGVRVMSADDKRPTQKIKSNLFNQPFKHPMQ